VRTFHFFQFNSFIHGKLAEMEVTSIASRRKVENKETSKIIHMFLKNNEKKEEGSEVFSKTKAEVRS